MTVQRFWGKKKEMFSELYRTKVYQRARKRKRGFLEPIDLTLEA